MYAPSNLRVGQLCLIGKQLSVTEISLSIYGNTGQADEASPSSTI